MAWSYYSTFVLEEAHGFNKSTVGLWLADTAKTVLLAAVIGLPVLAGFLRIIELAGKNFVPWLMLFMVGVQLTLQIIFPIFSEHRSGGPSQSTNPNTNAFPSRSTVQQVYPSARW